MIHHNNYTKKNKKKQTNITQQTNVDSGIKTKKERGRLGINSVTRCRGTTGETNPEIGIKTNNSGDSAKSHNDSATRN